MADFAFITQDLTIIHQLSGLNHLWDINPKELHNDYKQIFIYIDTEEHFKNNLITYPNLTSLTNQTIGITSHDHNAIQWMNHYPSIHGMLDISQLQCLLKKDQLQAKYDGVFVKVKNRLEKIIFNQIRWIMAKDVYSIIKTEDARFLVSHTLKDMEEKLLPYPQFSRIHRSYIVNINFIQAIEEGELIVDEEPLPIGPAYKEELMAKLLFM